MRNRKKIVTAVVLGMSMLLAGCGATGGTQKTSSFANEEEIAAATAVMSDELGDFNFSMDGKVCSLPTKANVFIEAGWTFPEDFLEKIDPYPAMTEWENCTMIKTEGEEEKELSNITLLNPSEEVLELKDVYVTSCAFDRRNNPKLIFSKGITWASSIEDVKNAFGTPDSEGSTGSEETFINTKLIYDVENGVVSFSFQTEGGKTKMTAVVMSYNKQAEYSSPGV